MTGEGKPRQANIERRNLKLPAAYYPFISTVKIIVNSIHPYAHTALAPSDRSRVCLCFSDRFEEEAAMSKKRYRPEEIISKLREADVLISQGKKVVEVIKSLGITDVTYYRWRQEYGGMSVPQAKRLKDLEKENERLRKAVSDLTLDKMIL